MKCRFAILACLILASCSGRVGQNVNAVGLALGRRIGFAGTPAALVDLSAEELSRITPETSGVHGIYFSDFVEAKNSNHIRLACDFANTRDVFIMDELIPLSRFSRFYGVEDGRLKVGRLDQFRDSTTVLPVRNRDHGYISRIEVEEGNNVPFFKRLYVESPSRLARIRADVRNQLAKEVIDGLYACEEARSLLGLSSSSKIVMDSLFAALHSKTATADSASRALMANLLERMITGQVAGREIRSARLRRQFPLISLYPAPCRCVFYGTDGLPVEEETMTAGVAGKIVLADSLGNAVFINRLKAFGPEELLALNGMLARHPMCPVLVDNGRYANFSLEKGSYREYVRQDLYHPDSCLFIVGSLRHP